ncbi:MAG TPA: YeeE/YedE family protein [Sandaracinaceae bacterium LLY-WYZ-13_1]|nr:YeeE/YedE family protein [Sandaracinaceae bacterium LLY-WYZ-13_1]
MKQNLTALVAGLLFGVGLPIAGMTQPSKVVGFLDFFGAWDPSLAFVMGGAIAVHFVLFRLILKRQSPLIASSFQVPTRRDMTPQLIGGAALFGVGWGLGGFCPGPGIVSLPAGSAEALTFVGAMTVGMLLYKGFDSLRSKKAATPNAGAPEPSAKPT